MGGCSEQREKIIQVRVGRAAQGARAQEEGCRNKPAPHYTRTPTQRAGPGLSSQAWDWVSHFPSQCLWSPPVLLTVFMPGKCSEGRGQKGWNKARSRYSPYCLYSVSALCSRGCLCTKRLQYPQYRKPPWLCEARRSHSISAQLRPCVLPALPLTASLMPWAT